MSVGIYRASDGGVTITFKKSYSITVGEHRDVEAVKVEIEVEASKIGEAAGKLIALFGEMQAQCVADLQALGMSIKMETSAEAEGSTS